MNAALHRAQHQGITLVETCCAMAVAVILAAIAVPALHGLLDTRRVQGVASRLAADLRLARTEALARQQGVRLSLHTGPGASCYVVHTGPADRCRCDADGPATCEPGAQALRTVHLDAADRVRIESNVDSMLFDPRRGTASPAGTLRVCGAGERTIQAVVNILGRVRTCSPGALVPGYLPC